MDRIVNKIKELRSSFEDRLVKCCETIGDATQIWAACQYSLEAPGKRIRPIIIALCGEMLGVKAKELFSFSLAIEFLHNASLVHDDLPALDNDDFRRGRFTCHKQFDEPTAVLAGDALIALSYGIVAKDETISSVQRAGLVGLLSDTFYKLCIGQVMDMEDMAIGIAQFNSRSESDLAKERLRKRHQHKTGALISACCVGPAIVMNQNSSQTVEKLAKFGLDLGLLFQITDDILDSLEEQEGKKPQDEEQNIPTYVSVYGLEGAREEASQVAQEAKAMLSTFGPQSGLLLELVDYILNRQQ